MNIYLILFASFSMTCLALPQTDEKLKARLAAIEAEISRLNLEANNKACDDQTVVIGGTAGTGTPVTGGTPGQSYTANPCLIAEAARNNNVGAFITAQTSGPVTGRSKTRCVLEGAKSYKCVDPGDDEGAKLDVFLKERRVTSALIQ